MARGAWQATVHGVSRVGHMTLSFRKGDPFKDRVGSYLTLRNELSEETHVLTKQETLLARGAQAESSRIREPRRTARSLGFSGNGISFRVVFGP